MFNEVLFTDWFHGQEWVELLNFLNENQLTAAADPNNRHISELVGVNYNWYGLAIQAAQSYIKGQDVFIVVNDIISHLSQSLKTPDNKLAQGVAQIKTLPDDDVREEQMIKYITTAIRVRARRFAGRIDNATAKMSVHFGDDSDNQFTYRQESPFDMEEIKKAVIEELKKMSTEANDIRAKNRLRFAAQVAVARLENPPNFIPLKELMKQFPNMPDGSPITKGTMNNIITDIQNAFARVAENFGMTGISGSIARIRKTA